MWRMELARIPSLWVAGNRVIARWLRRALQCSRDRRVLSPQLGLSQSPGYLKIEDLGHREGD